MNKSDVDLVVQTIESLLWSERKKTTVLKVRGILAGLCFAYTPGQQNKEVPGVSRLTVSRRPPFTMTEEEDRLILGILKYVLKEQKRYYQDVSLFPNHKVQGVTFTLITWEEYVKTPLL